MVREVILSWGRNSSYRRFPVAFLLAAAAMPAPAAVLVVRSSGPSAAVKVDSCAAVARDINADETVVCGSQFSQRSEAETDDNGHTSSKQGDLRDWFHELLLFIQASA